MAEDSQIDSNCGAEDSKADNDGIDMKGPHDTYTLEEAINETKIGKYQFILVILSAINFLGASIENTNVSYVAPYAKCDLKLSSGEQGLLSAIQFLGIIFTSHLWGFLADTWGRQKVLRASALGAFLFSFSSGFAINTASMLILRFLAGGFIAGSFAATYSYVSEFHTSSKQTQASVFIAASACAMWIVLSPLALLIIPMDWSFFIYTLEYKPWRLFLTCTSLINLWNAVAFTFLPESPKFLVAMNRKDEALSVLSKIYAINTGNIKESYPVKNIENVTLGNSLSNAKGFREIFELIVKQTIPIFKPPLLSYTWKMSFVIFGLFGVGHGGFMWFPDFLAQLRNYDGTPKTLCEIVKPKSTNSTQQICDIDNKNLFSFQLLFAVGLLYVGISSISTYYLKKIEPKKLVCVWLLLSIVASILLNFLTEFYVTAFTFIVFMSTAMCGFVIMAKIVNLFPTNYRGMATAFVMICGRIGSLTGTSGVGLLLTLDCNLMFYLYGGILICCNLVFMTAKINA